MCEHSDAEGRFASSDTGFMEVGNLAELPAGSTLRITVGEADLTLVNVDGRVVAIGDVCLRCSRSLSTAALDGGSLICGGCGWKYDVLRGCVEGLPNLRIEMHEVRVEDGRLFVSSAIAAPVSVS